MPEVRELREGESRRAAAALLELRPHVGSPAAMAERIDAQRADGYRVVAAFDADERGRRRRGRLPDRREPRVGALPVRRRPRHARAHRGRGHADAVMALGRPTEAARAGCDELHLDSGVGPEREDAHRFYFRHRMRITSYHFAGSWRDRGRAPAPRRRARRSAGRRATSATWRSTGCCTRGRCWPPRRTRGSRHRRRRRARGAGRRRRADRGRPAAGGRLRPRAPSRWRARRSCGRASPSRS